MADDDKIVQEIEIGGADQAAADLTKIGEAAEAAMGKLEVSANKASAALETLGDKGDDAGKKTSEGTKKAGDGASDLNKVEHASSSLGNALGEASAAASLFGKRIALVAGAATAAVGGIIALARSVAGQSGALDKSSSSANIAAESSRALNARLRQSSQAQVEAATKAVTHARALSDLSDQLAQGKLSATDYFKAVQDLERTARKDAEDTKKIQEIQRVATEQRFKQMAALQKEQDRLEKKSADKAAFAGLVDKFGSELTVSLIRLGVAFDSFWRRFVQGPSFLAKQVDAIRGFLEENGQAIINFYNRIATAILSIFDSKKAQGDIQTLSDKFKKFGEEVTVIIETIIVPVIKQVLTVFDSLAEKINGIFGTKLSGQGLIFILIIAKISGALTLLTGVVGILRIAFIALFAIITKNPIGLLITAIVLLGAWLLSKVDWEKFGKDAAAAWESIKTAFNAGVAIISGWWEWIKKGATDTWAWIVSGFDTVVTFFKNLPTTVGTFFSDLWNGIKQGATDAWQWVTDKAAAFVAWLADTWIGKLIGLMGRAFNAIKMVFDAQQQLQDSASGDVNPLDPLGARLAGGGPVRGRGTGTSDSILARLSNGEFVTKAAAVRRVGLRFMFALNAGRIRPPRFNMGGLVQRMQQTLVPRFAAGGLALQGAGAGSGRPVVLNIGNDSFHLMTRDANTAEQLGRAATQRRIASTGRKPGWVGGSR